MLVQLRVEIASTSGKVFCLVLKGFTVLGRDKVLLFKGYLKRAFSVLQRVCSLFVRGFVHFL